VRSCAPRGRGRGSWSIVGSPLYDYAWFAGFGVAFFLYWLLMRGTPELDLSDVPPVEA
jgi:cytosine/uracil/thiamine/allantoin permease